MELVIDEVGPSTGHSPFPDLTALSVAFLSAFTVWSHGTAVGSHRFALEMVLFVMTLPFWLFFAKALGLYDHDDARADHSTADEALGVINLVTLGTWVVFVIAWATNVSHPQLGRLISFWALALTLVLIGRVVCASHEGPRVRTDERRRRRRPCRPARRSQDPAASRVRDQARRLRRRGPARAPHRDRRPAVLGGLDDLDARRRARDRPRDRRLLRRGRRADDVARPLAARRGRDRRRRPAALRARRPARRHPL